MPYGLGSGGGFARNRRRAWPLGEARRATRREQPDVGHQQRDRPLVRARDVARLPERVVLALIAAHALEIVDLLAALEEQVADAAHDRRQGTVLQAGERRHAELEGCVSLLPAP